MSSLSQLKGTQRLSWPCRLELPSTSHLRLRTRGMSLMPAALSTQNSLDQPSASRRSLVNLGVDTGRGPSGRRPCRALNPELDRCHSPLTVAAPAYTHPARLISASVPTSLSSSSSRHPKIYAFGHLRDRAASPFTARTLGSYGTISPNRSFATSSPAMVANKIDGTAIAKQIRESIASDILEKQKLNPRFQPQLTIIQGMLRSYPDRFSPVPR